MAGRPIKAFDWSKLDAILQYNATLQDCSEVMEVSEDTIQRRIKVKFKTNFAAYRSKKLGKVRIMLVQKAIEQAKGGSAAMMIFCLKNLCGWVDRQEQKVVSTNETTIAYKDSDSKELLDKVMVAKKAKEKREA